jgi:protein tyrosine phosphatase (PTP) superfamily phosphohydrolase (DUF442 family)
MHRFTRWAFNKAVGLSLSAALIAAFLSTVSTAEEPLQSQRLPATNFGSLTKADAPIILCIDDKPASGGKPSEDAYAKAAANGFRSVLTLRAKNDGVDPLSERFIVEKQRLRYFNLPFLSTLPSTEQINEFLRLVRDRNNQPMLINCAFAERVAPYMMIFRVVEQGWSEEKALNEAVQAGLRREELKNAARKYFKSSKAG